MSNIISFSYLDSRNISKYNYTNTLVAEAVRVGKWSEADVTVLQGELMTALAEVIGYYTKNESSSVKTETARRLSLSMMYNIDTYLYSLGDNDLALATLKDRRAIETYGRGYLINKKHFEDAKHLYGKVRLTRLKDGSEAYNKTLDVYFYNYLKDYNPMFTAQDKIYLTLRKMGIDGAFHIDEAVDVLNKLLEINAGTQADVVISAENA